MLCTYFDSNCETKEVGGHKSQRYCIMHAVVDFFFLSFKKYKEIDFYTYFRSSDI